MPVYAEAQPPQPPVAAPARLRINSPTPATLPSTPPPIGAMRPAAPAPAGKKPRGKPSFGLGLLGGALGALVGMLIYFLVFKYTGFRIKLLAVGVGALAGWGAELLGRGEGSNELGGITAVFVLAGIIGAQYFVALGWWHEFSPTQIFNSVYTNNVMVAKEVVKAVPTGSNEEIRNYLAREEAGDSGEKTNPAAVTKEDIKEFREKNLPEYQDLASGKITKEQFNAKHGIDDARLKKVEDSEENTVKGIFLLLLVSRGNIISLLVAAGLAFKMSTNA
jgi:hypothetical protein